MAHAKTLAGRGLSAVLLAGGLAFLLTALATIATFAWPQPTMDQFRLYPIYLEQPFPQNILQRENGHRPVIPGLVRVAEIQWFGANQTLQIVVGTGCALLTALLMAAACLRQRELSWMARSAGAAAAIIGVFWLANARMLLHGNELVHAYLLTLCVVAGALAVWRAGVAGYTDAGGRSATGWMVLATLAGAVATFCFGPGIATFPAFAIMAWLLRLHWRVCLIPVLGCMVCLVLYVAVLPGDGQVRSGLVFRPWDALMMAARWLSSPWINAWLGFAEPALMPVHTAAIARGHGAYLVDSANAVSRVTGLSWATGFSTLFGMAGLAGFGAWLARAVWRRRIDSRLELLAGVLMLFGAASALIIGIGRLDFLEERPDQVFADRYLIWPCLFWLGLLLMALAQRARIGRVTRPIAIAGVLVLIVTLWPTHQLGAGWGASVYRNNQASAAAVRSHVLDPELINADDASVGYGEKLQSLMLFYQRDLAMFSVPGSNDLLKTWIGTIEDDADVRVRLTAAVPSRDSRPQMHPARFTGVITSGVSRFDGDSVLAVLDPDNRICGYAMFAQVGDDRPALRWSVPRKRGFEGFIHEYQAGTTYRLVRIDVETQQGLLLGVIPPPVMPAAAAPAG